MLVLLFLLNLLNLNFAFIDLLINLLFPGMNDLSAEILEVKVVSEAKSDVGLLVTVANQAAVAIENTELIVKTKVVQEELEARKKIEKAKGILMRDQHLDEETSYALMRKSSMNKRVPMKNIAEAIIISSEIKKDKK